VKLRSFLLSDASSLVHHADNPNVARYLREIFPSPYTFENANWWVTEGHKLGNSINFAVDLNGECIGGCGLNFLEKEHRYSCEMGYWLGQDHWGKGYATKVVSLLKHVAFKDHKILRLFAPVVDENIASKRALEKNGFVLEGVLKNHMFLRNKFYDECIYAAYNQKLDHTCTDQSH
jgi:RimJ/RimL family protein N-acetyltransferase